MLNICQTYIDHGFCLVPIPPGSKGPNGPNSKKWNHRESVLKSGDALPSGYGVGLAHAYSGTMALDIDNWEMAFEFFRPHGVNLLKLCEADDAVVIHSGVKNRTKLLFRMPEGVTQITKKVILHKKTVLEFRCATQEGFTVQDVLPPSIHPMTGKPYEWKGRGSWMKLPLIPDCLLTIWENLITTLDSVPSIEMPDSSELVKALTRIPPDCSREEWIQVGMSLHWMGSLSNEGDVYFKIWNEWSELGKGKYPGYRELRTQWNSFKVNKGTLITAGTLFKIAMDYGYFPPDENMDHLFNTNGPIMDASLLLHGLRPQPPSPDITVFPPILQRRAQEVSGSVGCDILVPLWAGISAACAVVDSRIRLELMPGFQVPPILWMMTVGEPADKKSPGSRPMLQVLRNLEAEDRPRFKKDLLEWESQEAAHSSAKKVFLEYAASPEALFNADGIPEVPDLPPQPVPLRITISDITSQKLIRSSADRPRGLLCYLDEMNSWIRKITDKNSGEDRSCWVVSYEGEPYEMDRVGTGSIRCDNLAVSIYGNIQPTVLRQNIVGMAGDGLAQRFLPAVLRSGETKLGEPIPEFLSHSYEWEKLLRVIYALPVQTYRLSPDAFAEFRKFQQWYEHTKREERLLQSSDVFMTSFGKIEGTTGRLILMFHLMEDPYNVVINVELVKRVIQFVRTYIIPSLRYTFHEIGSNDSFDIWLANYVLQYADVKKLTMSDLRNATRRMLEGKSSQDRNHIILCGMSLLESANWVKKLDSDYDDLRGKAQWAINPNILIQFKNHREEIISIKQKRLESRYRSRVAHGYEKTEYPDPEEPG